MAGENFTCAEFEEGGNDLKTHLNWVGKIRSLDFYGAPLGVTASERIISCQETLADYAQRIFDANQGL